MARLEILALNVMNTEQHQVYEETVSGRRGHAPAPLLAWIRNPELARRAQRLGELIRYETTLLPRLSELAILVTARYWTAQYEWLVHKEVALKADVDSSVIEAIANRRLPHFSNQDERAIYHFCSSLHKNHDVPEDIYRSAVSAIGEQGVVELVALLGYYTLVAMTLNTFEIGVPGGTSPQIHV
jgi:4-carboxymuconolactone decarboxylase